MTIAGVPAHRARGPVWAVLALGPGLAAFAAMSGLVVAKGRPSVLVVAVLLGIVVVLLNLTGAASAERAVQMWLLPRRGVTVTAVRNSPYGKNGVYEYRDASGVTRTYLRQSSAREVKVSYRPDRPDVAVGVYTAAVRVLVALGSLVLWAGTVGVAVAMITMGSIV